MPKFSHAIRQGSYKVRIWTQAVGPHVLLTSCHELAIQDSSQTLFYQYAEFPPHTSIFLSTAKHTMTCCVLHFLSLGYFFFLMYPSLLLSLLCSHGLYLCPNITIFIAVTVKELLRVCFFFFLQWESRMISSWTTALFLSYRGSLENTESWAVHHQATYIRIFGVLLRFIDLKDYVSVFQLVTRRSITKS